MTKHLLEGILYVRNGPKAGLLGNEKPNRPKNEYGWRNKPRKGGPFSIQIAIFISKKGQGPKRVSL